MFNKIVILNPILITDTGKNELKKYCKELIEYESYCDTDAETIKRINDADCVMVSSKTILNANILEKCSKLKFICFCCSYYGKEFSKVDINYLEENNIEYRALKSHGDNGVIEFTLSQVINLINGFGDQKLKNYSHDLTGLKVGILGLGTLGQKIAKIFNMLETTVYYYSKTRKKHLENDQLIYLDLDNLLKTVDVLSINLNRDTCLIDGDKLNIFGNNKIIVNTSIGYCYESKSLINWLKNKNNFYICDEASTNDDLKEILNYENVIYVNRSTGDTKECYIRATTQIIDNIKNYLTTK